MPDVITNTEFQDAVMSELETKSLETLAKHPGKILDAAIHATERVFVSSPEDDTPAEKVSNVANMLRSLADAVENDDNPLGLEFVVNPDTNAYTKQVRFNITTAFAGENLVPATMFAKSRRNRVRKAAKNVT